ncbi:MAG: TIGR04255 family protein [Phycisphaerales bacterium]|nr:TIGR04255 family protein [Phycisphaerales bacterium]
MLGVQFRRLPRLRNAHLGAYWKSLGPEWPNVADAAPIDPQYERFDAPVVPMGQRLRLTLSSDPASRLQIRDASTSRMIQVQNGRFHLNWIATDDEPRYPRFRTNLPVFLEELERFRSFLNAERIGEPEFDQWEVTYVNRFVRGRDWGSPADLGTLLPSLLGPLPAHGGLAPEVPACTWRFVIAPQRGRLHLELENQPRQTESGEEAAILKLTARGPMNEGQPTIEEGLKLGHDVIVQSFVEITSREAHRKWGRTQ